MSLWPRDTWGVGIGLSGVALARNGALVAEHVLGAMPQAGGVDPFDIAAWRDCLSRAGQDLASRSKGRGRLLIADGLVRHWLMAAPPGVRSLDELQAVAKLRCAQVHGGAPDHWSVCADWNARDPFLCGAIPRSLNSLVGELLPGLGGVHALLGGLLDAVGGLPSDAWICVLTPSHGTILRTSTGRLQRLRSIVLPEPSQRGEHLEYVAVEVLRESLRSQQPVGGQVFLMDMTFSSHAAVGVQGIRFEALAPRRLSEGGVPRGCSDAALAATMALMVDGGRSW